ncbi:multidrug and toxin extrusion protein 1-like [Lineus longissimus]|uniref:multidrug and toxin extrusion protein 1-like n=1 Tax=Lineus longissimus TaxID=88925 RepID=UPI002B4F1786
MTHDSEEHLFESQRDDVLMTASENEPTKVDKEPRCDEVVEKRRICCCRLPTWLGAEMKAVYNLSWTMALVFLFNTMQGPITLLFSGHLGTKQLGGVALATTVIKVAGTTIGAGLATACDTTFSQTFGSGNKKYVGVYLQRGIMIIGLFVLPCWAVFLNTESLLLATGQESEIARIAGQFTLIYMPALPMMYLYTVLARYIRNQGILIPFLVIGICGLVINTLCQYVFVMALDFGTDGSAIGRIFGTYTLALGTLGYILISKIYKETWSGFTADAFQDWGNFLSLAVFGLLNSFLIWLGFEAGTILAGTLGEIQLGAQSITFQIETITFCFSMGTGVGTNIRVGHLLGANNPKQARRAVFGGYALVCIESVVLVTFLLSLKDYLPMIFSDDPDVIKTSSNIIPILALFNFFDMICGCSSGILRGCGRQRTSAMIVFCGMYLVGLPLGISLMFLTDLGTAGFWWGVTLALCIESIAYFTAVMKTDWDKEAQDAQVRAGVKRKLAEERARESETTALLIEEKQQLPKQTNKIPQQRKYCGEYDSSQVDISIATRISTRLSTSQLVFRRSLFVLTAILVLAIGIFCRFHFHFTNVTSLCIPSNFNSSGIVSNVTNSTGTWITVGNVTFPLCRV